MINSGDAGVISPSSESYGINNSSPIYSVCKNAKGENAMNYRRIIGILLVMSLLLSVFCVPVNASAQTYAQNYLDEQMEEYDIHGVVYVTKNGEVLCQSARGIANTAESKEMTVDTLFPIGSNSKQFCAAAILLLQEQGKLSVDDPVSEYFPEYTIAKDVTIKNLLTMRSGICNHPESLFKEYTLSEDATSEENIQTILEWLYTKKLLFTPDKAHRYSNTNYLLLSIIVEQVSGQSYADFIEENIFVPLGMNNSGFYEELKNHPDLAEHNGEADAPIDPDYKGLIQGSGDLVSTAEDMDKWMTSLKECTILSEESVNEMTTDYSRGTGYGYGVRLQNDGELFHDGAIVTYLSFVFTYPDEGFNVFAVTNDIENEGNMLANLFFETVDELKNLGITGDTNCDGVVNVKDATAIQKHIADLITLTDEGYAVADVDESGAVNIKDATAIQKRIAGLI